LPKLVHLNVVWKAAIWVMYLKKTYRLRYVVTESWAGYKVDNPDNIFQRSFFQKKITRYIYQNCLNFISITKDLVTVCQRLYGPIQHCIVENAVDRNLFYYEPPQPNKIKLVHVSTMNYQKNTIGLLQTLAAMPLENYNLELTLIGPADATIINMVNNNKGLKECTVITGNIPYAQVATYMRQSDIFVLFSRYENLPCVILEALCCGVPVITTDVGGIREVMNDSNGILIENENEAQLKTALEKMLFTYKQYNRKAISLDSTNKYSYEAIGKKYQLVYAELLK
jgi:glycosyltransferase involved in cell wall biosynthesis